GGVRRPAPGALGSLRQEHRPLTVLKAATVRERECLGSPQSRDRQGAGVPRPPGRPLPHGRGSEGWGGDPAGEGQGRDRPRGAAQSWLHEASTPPSGEKARPLTWALWPSRVKSSWPVTGSQIRTVRVLPATARLRPSGL